MIIYNVTIKVDAQIADAWQYWMKAEHMPDLMNTDMFIDCRLCRLLEQDETEGITFIAQYFCDDMEAYNQYIDRYSTIMRDKANKIFGGKFIAFRTIMEVL